MMVSKMYLLSNMAILGIHLILVFGGIPFQEQEERDVFGRLISTIGDGTCILRLKEASLVDVVIMPTKITNYLDLFRHNILFAYDLASRVCCTDLVICDLLLTSNTK